MHKSKTGSRIRSLIGSSMLALTMVLPMQASAQFLQSQQQSAEAAFRAAIVEQMQRSAQQAKAAQSQQEQAALNGDNCKRIKQEAEQTAQRSMDLRMPPDPSKIIKNTTCFADVSKVKIPVSMTGVGFLDGLISSQLHQFMDGVCNKSQNFLSDLKTSAMTQLDSATGGSAGQLLNSINSSSFSSDLDAAVMRQASDQFQSFLSSTQSATQGSTTTAQATQPNELQRFIEDSRIQGVRLMCGYGVADAAYCPTCMSNPAHNSCIGPRPYCHMRTDLSPPLCREAFIDW